MLGQPSGPDDGGFWIRISFNGQRDSPKEPILTIAPVFTAFAAPLCHPLAQKFVIGLKPA
jgi:hypothetical protein